MPPITTPEPAAAMATPIDLATLIPRCHQASKANGWWDSPRNAGEALMLCVAELSECLEAHRKDKWANMRGMRAEEEYIKQMGEQDKSWGKQRWALSFESSIKDSVEDELADAYIRLCDFTGGFELDLKLIESSKCDPATWVISGDNFGEALMTCTEAVVAMNKVRRQTGFCNGSMEAPLCDTLTLIEVLAAREGIDLATHIDLKLAYNKFRGHKHGGKAY